MEMDPKLAAEVAMGRVEGKVFSIPGLPNDRFEYQVLQQPLGLDTESAQAVALFLSLTPEQLAGLEEVTGDMMEEHYLRGGKQAFLTSQGVSDEISARCLDIFFPGAQKEADSGGASIGSESDNSNPEGELSPKTSPTSAKKKSKMSMLRDPAMGASLREGIHRKLRADFEQELHSPQVLVDAIQNQLNVSNLVIEMGMTGLPRNAYVRTLQRKQKGAKGSEWENYDTIMGMGVPDAVSSDGFKKVHNGVIERLGNFFPNVDVMVRYTALVAEGGQVTVKRGLAYSKEETGAYKVVKALRADSKPMVNIWGASAYGNNPKDKGLYLNISPGAVGELGQKIGELQLPRFNMGSTLDLGRRRGRMIGGRRQVKELESRTVTSEDQQYEKIHTYLVNNKEMLVSSNRLLGICLVDVAEKIKGKPIETLEESIQNEIAQMQMEIAFCKSGKDRTGACMAIKLAIYMQMSEDLAQGRVLDPSADNFLANIAERTKHVVFSGMLQTVSGNASLAGGLMSLARTMPNEMMKHYADTDHTFKWLCKEWDIQARMNKGVKGVQSLKKLFAAIQRKRPALQHEKNPVATIIETLEQEKEIAEKNVKDENIEFVMDKMDQIVFIGTTKMETIEIMINTKSSLGDLNGIEKLYRDFETLQDATIEELERNVCFLEKYPKRSAYERCYAIKKQELVACKGQRKRWIQERLQRLQDLQAKKTGEQEQVLAPETGELDEEIARLAEKLKMFSEPSIVGGSGEAPRRNRRSSLCDVMKVVEDDGRSGLMAGMPRQGAVVGLSVEGEPKGSIAMGSRRRPLDPMSGKSPNSVTNRLDAGSRKEASVANTIAAVEETVEGYMKTGAQSMTTRSNEGDGKGTSTSFQISNKRHSGNL